MSFPYGYEFEVGAKVLVYRRGYGDRPVVPIVGTIAKVGQREFAVTVPGPETIRFSLRFAEAIGNDRVTAEPYDEAKILAAKANLRHHNSIQAVKFMLGELGKPEVYRHIHARLGTITQAEAAEELLRETIERLAEFGVSGMQLPRKEN